MIDLDLTLAVPIGVAIGLVVGTIGGGGAILALPALVYALGEGVSPATTASLIVVALGASVGAGLQARRGLLCVRIAASFAAPAVAGAYLGTIAGAAVDPRALILAFVPVMLVAALVTWRGRPVDAAEGDGGCPPLRPVTIVASGLAVGWMTGFFGVGGGFLIVPALTLALSMPIRRAISTSLAVITITGLAALISHLAAGAEPNWSLTLVLCSGAALGAAGGVAIGERLPARALSGAFAVVVAAVAAFLLIDVLALGGPPSG